MIAIHRNWSRRNRTLGTWFWRPLLYHCYASIIHLNHRPPVYKQLNSKRIKVERPESNRRPERDSVSLPLAYIPRIAGGGFEPPFSRIWALRDSSSLPCEWEKMESNHPSPKATDLQPAPLPLRNILPEPGSPGLAICLSCYAFH